jgi:hypothetical protein
LDSRLNAGLIISTSWDPTAEAASIYYTLDWGEGKTNIPDSKDDAQLTSPHINSSGGRQVSASIALVEVVHNHYP